MKVWYHVIAALVGLSIAALIVYLVFGSASEQGAAQDGDAGTYAASANLCGSISPAKVNGTKARSLAGENLPALFDAKGPLQGIAASQPDQLAWVERVHAASGLCIDELHIERSGATSNVVKIAMSTTGDISETDGAAYVAAVLPQVFTMPFLPAQVTVVATIGGTDRTIVMSRRAWRAYDAQRKQLGLTNSVKNLKLFKKAAGASLGRGDLTITGW